MEIKNSDEQTEEERRAEIIVRCKESIVETNNAMNEAMTAVAVAKAAVQTLGARVSGLE